VCRLSFPRVADDIAPDRSADPLPEAEDGVNVGLEVPPSVPAEDELVSVNVDVLIVKAQEGAITARIDADVGPARSTSLRSGPAALARMTFPAISATIQTLTSIRVSGRSSLSTLSRRQTSSPSLPALNTSTTLLPTPTASGTTVTCGALA